METCQLFRLGARHIHPLLVSLLILRLQTHFAKIVYLARGHLIRIQAHAASHQVLTILNLTWVSMLILIILLITF